MAICHGCGNEYDKCFKIIFNNKELIFDSFECAINTLAPICQHCQNKIIGHGVEEKEKIYCCAHCAKKMGALHLKDRA